MTRMFRSVAWLLLALLLATPTLAQVNCGGTFPASSLCGTSGSPGLPGPVTYAPSAVVDTTNASNITSGTLPLGRLPAGATANVIDVFAIGGQSNAQGNSLDGTLSPLVPTGKVLQYYGSTISDANDPVGPAIGGSAWPAFGNAYYGATGRPILFVPSAVGGTDQCSTTGVSAQNWSTTGTLAPALVANVTAAMSAARAAGYSPIYRGILWSQGENDAGAIGNNPVYPSLGFTTVTGGPYAAGTTVITVASATGVSINEVALIFLDNGTSYSTNITNVSGTTVTLQAGVPAGRSILNGATFQIYSQAMYRSCFFGMASNFRTTTTDGTTFPQLPIYISQTGGPQAGDGLGYQKVRQAQDQIAQSDPYTHVVYRGAVDFITRGMMQAGSLHYLQEGYNEMGREMAKGVISAQTSDAPFAPNENVSRVTLGGTLRTGDQLILTITSSAVAGSPWQLGPVVVGGASTFASIAAGMASNGTIFSPNLAERGIYVTSSGNVITVHQPASPSPQALVTASWTTGGATETATVTTGVSAYASVPKASTPKIVLHTSGSGADVTPSGARYGRVLVVGGGGGGAGSGTSPGAAGAGGASTFGGITANGGAAGATTAGASAVGGTATGGDDNQTGGSGGPASNAQTVGGEGGVSCLGGAGHGGAAVGGGGIAATTNSGSGGGGGAMVSAVNGGGGGGAGGCAYAILGVSSPLAPSYAWSVGAAGAGGTAGTGGVGGAGGGAGKIRLEWYFQ